MSTLTYTGTLQIEDCCNCGITFAMPDELMRKLRRSHDVFYCPAGHGQHYTAKSDAQLRREAEAERDAALNRNQRLKGLLEDERGMHKRTELKLRATRGVVTRTKRRIKEGLCPKCHASFPALAEHIAQEHPDYDPQDAGE